MRAPISSTIEPFDWEVVPSGTDLYWTLCWALLAKQLEVIADAGIEPLRPHGATERYSKVGTFWTPAVDLALGRISTFTVHDVPYRPARDIVSITAGDAAERIHAGTALRLEAALQADEHMGTNYWSVVNDDLDVSFVNSALGGRWGGAACLADGLIVPIEHPIVGDRKRADRLVRDLQAVTRSFRTANGLSARTG